MAQPYVAGSSVAEPSEARRAPAPVRLTRRGRIVVLTLLLLVAATIVVLAAPTSGSAGPGGSVERPTVVVQPGDTLWSVASRQPSRSDVFAVIEEIRRLNGLTDYTVHPGQRLIVPSR